MTVRPIRGVDELGHAAVTPGHVAKLRVDPALDLAGRPGERECLAAGVEAGEQVATFDEFGQQPVCLAPTNSSRVRGPIRSGNVRETDGEGELVGGNKAGGIEDEDVVDPAAIPFGREELLEQLRMQPEEDAAVDHVQPFSGGQVDEGVAQDVDATASGHAGPSARVRGVEA